MSKLIITASLILTLGAASSCAANPNGLKEGLQKQALAAQTYIKPGAGIGYSHDLKSQYSAGENVSFTLNLGESYDGGVMRVTLTSDGVQLNQGRGSTNFDMGTGGEHDMAVSFNASSNGRHYINVQTLADLGDGNAMSRVFSIPVQVGPVTAQKPNPNMQISSDGENIIGMNAEEEIK